MWGLGCPDVLARIVRSVHDKRGRKLLGLCRRLLAIVSVRRQSIAVLVQHYCSVRLKLVDLRVIFRPKL